jgi:polyhydroxybutyrate depolymerase
VHGLGRARTVAAWALASLCALAALAPGAGAQYVSPVSPSPPGCSPPGRTGRFFVTIPVDGVQRSALVNAPQSSDGTQRLPLVLVFHGASSTGPETEAHLGMSAIGNRYGFITVYPDTYGDYFDYTRSAAQGNADVDFVRALLDTLDQRLCVDDARVYAAGGSNGGAFVARLACDMSDRLAAVAAVAGAYPAQPPCQPARPVSLLEIHGTRDHYYGWPSLGGRPVPAFLSQWMTLDRCPSGPPARRRFAPAALLWEKVGCAGGTVVAHLRLHGGIHAWPGGYDVTRAPQVDFDVSASLAVWQFFDCQATASGAGAGCPPPQRARVRARSHRRRR